MTETVVQFPEPAGLLSLRDMPERPPIKTWYSGFPEFRNKIALAPRTLSVVSGHPGHGKSTLMGNIWFNTAATEGINIIVASFENHPMPDYRKMLRQFWAGLPEREMNADQCRQADDFIHEHYRFIVHPQERPTLEWLLDMASGGGDFEVLLIDPWNRIESQRQAKETETEYIAYCLTELRLFAKNMDCHVQIIAHPAKRDPKFRDRTPCLEDISGSKNWDNMPDQGFIVHRDKFWDPATNERQFDAKLYHMKARYEELGYPCCMEMRMSPKNGRFDVKLGQ